MDLEVHGIAGYAVMAPAPGVITSTNYCYDNDDRFTLVEVTCSHYIHRMLYVGPSVEVGEHVAGGQTIGVAQDIRLRYDKNMLMHIHWEVRIKNDLILAGRGRKTDIAVWVDPLDPPV